jgi:hypothetical protein
MQHTLAIDVPATSRDGSLDIIVFQKDGVSAAGQVFSRVFLQDLGKYRKLRLKTFYVNGYTTSPYNNIYAAVSGAFILKLSFGNKAANSNATSSLRQYTASTATQPNLLTTEILLPYAVPPPLSANGWCDIDVPKEAGYIDIAVSAMPGMTLDYALRSLTLWFDAFE